MKTSISFLFLILLLVGCSSAPKKEDSGGTASSEFIGGGVTLVYSKKGQLLGVSSKATANASGKLQNSVDQAVAVATLKARRQIAEFISTEVTSNRFVTTVSSDLQRSSDDGVELNKEGATNIALELRETIRQRSNQLLKGTVVDKETYDADSGIVTVVVRAGSAERKAADALRGMVTR